MSEETLFVRSHLPVPVSDVQDWHGRPGAFERLTPPWMDVRVLDAKGTTAPGDWKRLRIGGGLFGFNWTIVHRAGEHGAAFVDEQERGPYRSWRHEHFFLPDGDDSSLLEDRITYRLPFGAIGALVAGGLVKHRLDNLFRFRHHRTRADVSRHAAAGLGSSLRIAVTGSSGLVGRQLVPFLGAGGHEVVPIVRRKASTGEIFWDPARGEIDAAALEGIDAVVHLAGESIAGGRWTEKRRQAILTSRFEGTGLLARTLAQLNSRPRVFVSASAIGYYGHAGTSTLTEQSPPGEGFLAEVCRAWENAATPAAAAGIRVVHPRIAPIVAGDGGFLTQMLRPFKFGAGGPIGNGEQVMSWIARDDLLGIILHAIADDRLSGPINASSPNPVTNRDFSRTLGRVLLRPSFMRTPATALRLVLGELADELLLSSQSVRSSRLEALGFRFDFPTLEDALRHELGRYDGQAETLFHRSKLSSAQRLESSPGTEGATGR